MIRIVGAGHEGIREHGQGSRRGGLYRVMEEEKGPVERTVLLEGWTSPHLKAFWPCYRLVEYPVDLQQASQ